MVIFTLTLTPKDGRRPEVLDVLESVVSVARLTPGCMSSSVYSGHSEKRQILYLERWATREDLYRHIQSNLFLRVLAAIELGSCPPEIHFDESSETRGFELIEELKTRGSAGAYRGQTMG